MFSFLVLVFISTFSLASFMPRYPLSRSLRDIPNARSSHSVPTPRGGGLAVVLVFLAISPVIGYQGWLSWPLVIGLAGSGAWIAIIGFLDDHGHVAARWRLLAHFLGAGWFLVWLPALPSLAIFGTTFDLGFIGYVLAAVMLVWVLNLFNFMDGIDGIASVEAITVCVGGALLYALIGVPALAATPLLLAASVAGFLVWNFPPAKIFMGDAGSGFLGIALGGLTLQAAWAAPQLLWAWLILLGVFVLDATFTLLRRLLRGDKVFEAHRSHAYQYASREYGAHLPVTLAVLAINVLWLLPWACLVALGYIDGLLALLIASLPLALLAVRFRSGQLD